MPLFALSLLYLVIGIALLWAGAEGLVRSSQTLALRSGVTPLVTGLTVVAFGTSAPEMVASVAAGLYGSSDMALGNVIGSNISNIGLVLGLAALIAPLTIHRGASRIDGPVALGSTLLLMLLLVFDNVLARIEGLFLLAGIIAYTIWRTRTVGSDDEVKSDDHTLNVTNAMLGLVLLGSLAALAAGAYSFVVGAKSVAVWLGVSEAVIGLTVMAVGTSLPEIATVVAAARKGLSDLVVGNVVGSNIFNILSVLGVTALIVPLERHDVDDVDMLVFAGSAVILVGLMIRPRIGKSVGVILTVGYCLYVAHLYLS